jgi:predicted nucleic acid-binding protein
VPSLWYFEVGNTLARKYPQTAARQLDLLCRIGLTEPPWNGVWHAAILDLTRRYPVTFYDASYHALAIVADGQFVTADEQHLQRAAEAGHLAHLKDWRAA